MDLVGIMRSSVLIAAGLAAALALSGCKFVKTGNADGQAPASGEAGDDARIDALLTETYDARLVPMLSDKATEFTALKNEFANGIDAAGEAQGVRAGGAGGSWIFAIKATGKVVAENRKSKAATADVDVDGDGKADISLQLGPVVKGTALRDVAPSIYDFSAFRDQIEFAKLGRALNDKAISALPAAGELEGKTIAFTGAAAIRSTSEIPLVVPVIVEVSP